ncbi:MAG: hypothetical protein GTO08_05695, partial [Deltaproteobacteria bacterium]|nr:hypothetical protein [Deltaproteobacteria bacterium]
MSAHRDFTELWIDTVGPANVDGRADFCLQCHGGNAFTGALNSFTGGLILADGVSTNPTEGIVPSLPTSHGADRGTGSHMIGTMSAGLPFTVPRATDVAWESGFYSLYSNDGIVLVGNAELGATVTITGGTTEVVCESCHNILYNVGSEGNTAGITASGTSGYDNNLLLARYEDDTAGVGVGPETTVGSLLCVGCHTGGGVAWGTLDLDGNKPTGTHPV